MRGDKEQRRQEKRRDGCGEEGRGGRRKGMGEGGRVRITKTEGSQEKMRRDLDERIPNYKPVAIVLAVNMPGQEPAVGQEHLSMF